VASGRSLLRRARGICGLSFTRLPTRGVTARTAFHLSFPEAGQQSAFTMPWATPIKNTESSLKGGSLDKRILSGGAVTSNFRMASASDRDLKFHISNGRVADLSARHQGEVLEIVRVG